MDQLVTSAKGKVCLVDDDIGVQRGVAALLTAADYDVEAFASAEDFLAHMDSVDLNGAALLVDVCMPGIQGLELQETLKADGINLPVIVMTAHGDVPMAVRAMRNGAIDFLEKPFTVDEITSALERALQGDRPPAPPAQNSAIASEIADRYKLLSPRERDVFKGIVEGAANKEIARDLDISPRTVEVHRQKIMVKMQAGNFAELVRMAVALDF